MGGGFAANYLSPEYLKWTLAIVFFGFAFWILIPDKHEEVNEKGRFGPFITVLILFFLAEMGDKTQLATLALGAKYSNPWIVTIGTTLGMLASNSFPIFFGEKWLKKIPMKWVRATASISFFIFGFVILFGF